MKKRTQGKKTKNTKKKVSDSGSDEGAPDQKVNDFGGLPDRNLKKSLGC